MIVRSGIAVLAALALAGPAIARPQSANARNRAVVAAFAHMFYDQRDVRGAFEHYVAVDYTQHNPDIPDGREAAITALTPIFSQAGSRFEVKQILVDGDLAVIHLWGRTGSEGTGGDVADFFRLRHGKIVEHWDVLQPMRTGTINPHPYF